MSKKNSFDTNNFFNVQQAAEFLGVNPGTIRRWAQSRTVQGLKVGVRGDWRFTKEALLDMAKANIELDSNQELSVLHDRNRTDVNGVSFAFPGNIAHEESITSLTIPHLDWIHVNESEHFVQFYESDSFLLDSLSKFIGVGLREGDACIVVATPEHRQSLEERLKLYGIDVTNSVVRAQFIMLDAEATLSQFMVQGVAQYDRFSQTVEEVIAKIPEDHRNIRIFGEMVALLWTAGNPSGAIHLERMWNDFQKSHAFSLFCAYPMHGFSRESHGVQFHEIGRGHSKVIPTESYTALVNPDERFRAIALLQQKAESLEAEINERKKLERQKDEFLAAASHELKTPLTSIKAYTQVLKYKFQKSNNIEAVSHLSKMDAQLNKLSSLVADLLDVTKIDAGKLQFQEEYFDLNALIEETVEEIQLTTKHAIIKKLSFATNIFGDRGRIGQVITNLLSNAIKYSPQDKKIIIASRIGRDAAEVSVKDFGLGIEHEDQERVFQRFYRVRESETYPGMGLGLHIASEIIKRHKGRIWVESVIGKGSTFHFTLPVGT